jgi:hypothetical protein
LRAAALAYPLQLSLNALDSLNYFAKKAAIAGTLPIPNPKGESVMADLPGYIGILTGLIGTFIGIAAYVRSNQVKKLDLRLELRKGLGDAHEALSTLQAVMEAAANSRPRVLAMRGLGGSGNMIAWEQSLATDRAEVDRLAPLLRDEAADFTALSTEQLESEIVSAHKLKASLATLVDKYRGELAADDEARRQRHHEVVTMTAAQMAPANRPDRV